MAGNPRRKPLPSPVLGGSVSSPREILLGLGAVPQTSGHGTALQSLFFRPFLASPPPLLYSHLDLRQTVKPHPHRGWSSVSLPREQGGGQPHRHRPVHHLDTVLS